MTTMMTRVTLCSSLDVADVVDVVEAVLRLPRVMSMAARRHHHGGTASTLRTVDANQQHAKDSQHEERQNKRHHGVHDRVDVTKLLLTSELRKAKSVKRTVCQS